MRRETKLKKSLGFGRTIEVPAPVYLQAALMGLVDEMPKGYFYVLPGSLGNECKNYARCARVNESLTHYVPTPLRIWNHYEDSKAPIAVNGGASRVLTFLRGSYLPSSTDEINRVTRLMVLYLEQLVDRLEDRRDWNLDLEDFVLGQTHQPARDWMAEVLWTNRFDFMIAAHKRYKTE